MHRFRPLILVLGLLAPLGARAEHGAAPLSLLARPFLRTFGLREGLPNATVYAIQRDREGRLWIGTQDGAAVYNGHHWQTVDLPKGSPSTFIRALLAASDGSLWFGTQDGGLWRRAPVGEGGGWTHVGRAEGLPSDRVYSLLEARDPDGATVMWVGTGGGLAKLRAGRWERFTVASGHLPDDWVWKVAQVPDPDGRPVLWACTQGGLVRMDGPHWKAITPKEGLPGPNVNDIVARRTPDGRREVWVSLWNHGVVRQEGDGWVTPGAAEGFPSALPVTMNLTPAPGGGEVLWVGTYDAGIAWLDAQGWHRLQEGTGLASNGVYSLLAHPGGHPALWAGTRGGGLVSLDLSAWYTVDRETGLPSPEVTAMLETDLPGQPRYWIGTNRGLACFDGDRWRREPMGPAGDGAYVNALLLSRAGGRPALWAGTIDGLAERTPAGWRVIRKGQGLPDSYVHCLLETEDPDGPTLWVGTKGGLSALHNGRWRTWTPADGLPHAWVYGLLETRDPDGRRTLWVGTRGGGLARLRDGRLETVALPPGTPGLSIYALKEVRSRDGRRWLWVGTIGGGLFRRELDREGAPWTVHTVDTLPGLPSNVAFRLETDPAGRLVVTTARGVVRLRLGDDGAPASLEGFGPGDGLPSLACSVGASLVDSGGRVWVGTLTGTGILDPALEIPAPPLPPLILDRAWVRGRERLLTPGTRLAPDEDRLSLEVALPTFFREEDLRYRTQLEGLEREPSEWTASNRREFSALPPGSYVLEVQARDHLGRESAPLRIPFRLAPPFYLTPWAYALYALAAAGAVWGILVLRTRFLQERNRALEARVAEATSELAHLNERLVLLNEEKNHFLGLVSHDLKNPLNAISIMGQEIAMGLVSPDEAADSGRKIHHLVAHMIQLMTRLLDVNAIESGKMTLNLGPMELQPLAEQVRESFDGRARAKGIGLTLEAPEAPLTALADPLYLQEVLENLVSNAVKFTPPAPPERRVWIRLGTDGEEAVLEVRDEGPGFSEEDKRRAYGRFARLSARPTAGESSTGLGLSITRRLVEAMGGKLELDSEPGHGATFRIRLPKA